MCYQWHKKTLQRNLTLLKTRLCLQKRDKDNDIQLRRERRNAATHILVAATSKISMTKFHREQHPPPEQTQIKKPTKNQQRLPNRRPHLRPKTLSPNKNRGPIQLSLSWSTATDQLTKMLSAMHVKTELKKIKRPATGNKKTMTDPQN